MMKNSIAQTCGQGSIVIASGYVTKANPGPPVATEETGRPVSWDINPITEKTTKPAKILVPQFKIGTRIESLQKGQLRINRLEDLVYSPFVVVSKLIIAGHINYSTPAWTKREKYLNSSICPYLTRQINQKNIQKIIQNHLQIGELMPLRVNVKKHSVPSAW